MAWRILLLDAYHADEYGQVRIGTDYWRGWRIGQIHSWEEGDSNWSLRELKESFKRREVEGMIVQHEEHILYANHITLTQADQTRPLEDETKLGSLRLTNLTMIVISKSVLSCRLLQVKLPHMNLIHREELLTRLQSLKMNQVDLDSIREIEFNSAASPTTQVVSIRNFPAGTFTNHITIDGEEYVPHQVDVNSKLVEFRIKYSYQYSTTSEEYAQELTKSKEMYESELAHCKKLLHDLPIALLNSKNKLYQDTKSAREHSLTGTGNSGIDLSDLGALSVEQSVITDEIEVQRERLRKITKKSFKVNKSKFIPNEFHFVIHLPFGWHQFGTNFYQLLPIPTLKELQRMLFFRPNRHTVCVKRKRNDESDTNRNPPNCPHENDSDSFPNPP